MKKAQTVPKNWPEYWDSDAFWSRSRIWDINAELFLTKLNQIYPFHREDIVLDLGCGPGFTARRLAQEVASVTAVDLSENMIKLCRQHCAANSNVKAEVLPAGKLVPEKLGSFDWILCISMVQYYSGLDQIELLIEEASKIAKPGGKLLIADLPMQRSRTQKWYDQFCSLLQSLRHHYFAVYYETAQQLRQEDNSYSRFSSTVPVLTFTEEWLASLQKKIRWKSEILRTNLSICANRPSLLITY